MIRDRAERKRVSYMRTAVSEWLTAVHMYD